MMDVFEQISLYSTLSYVLLSFAVLSFGLSVFFFFYFKIPALCGFQSAKSDKQAIQQISNNNIGKMVIWRKMMLIALVIAAASVILAVLMALISQIIAAVIFLVIALGGAALAVVGAVLSKRP